jgi:hypothetical protein
MSISLSMAFAAKKHRGRRTGSMFKVNIKPVKSIKFQFGTCRPTVYKMVSQYFEPFIRFVKKGSR